jgi:hypothetical protein
MKTVLNSPLEVGVRVLIVLTETFPESLDLSRLVLLDHGVINSGDLGGPSSIHPALPIRVGELSVKRSAVEEGLHVMLRAGLVEMAPTARGIEFRASDNAYSFISILASPYAGLLRDRARWIVRHFPDLSEETLRTELSSVFGSWAEEFDNRFSALSEGGFGA